MSLKEKLKKAKNEALKSGNKVDKTAISSVLSQFLQFEKDNRVENVNESQALQILEKGIKQRKESITQFKAGGREDLVAKEQAEIDVLENFMPEKLSEEDVLNIIDKAILETEAKTMKDMKSVISIVKPQVQGKADMGFVSKTIKSKLS